VIHPALGPVLGPVLGPALDSTAGHRDWTDRRGDASVPGVSARPRTPALSARPLTLRVRARGAAYPVRLERGVLGRAGRWLRTAGLGGRAIVVSDANVAALYGGAVLTSLARAGIEAALVTVPPGERTKTLATAGRLYGHFADLGADRDTPIVALGGGVVGDLAGFAAATYLRGLPLVHLPTTVLAQADSAIGGKTGVDLPRGKNLVGAFHPPRLVLVDPEVLWTLPARQVRAGLAEIAKVGMALDAGLFRLLEERAEDLQALAPGVVDTALARALRAKAVVVSADERDRGRRQLLNYGHTVGHALEAAGGYRRWLHGEAVACGMLAAARLSAHRGLLSAPAEARQAELLGRLGLARRFPRVSAANLLSFMELDKKWRAGRRTVVLTAGVGVARVRRDLSRQELMRALRSVGAEP
jgi:3-dehydroquinate synthase